VTKEICAEEQYISVSGFGEISSENCVNHT
jgi:hypothetical protein